MKLRELFHTMKKANDFAKMVGDREYLIYISLNGYSGRKYHTFKEFQKELKEWTKNYQETLLSLELHINQRGECSQFFEVYNPFFGDDRCSIDLYIFKE